MSAQQVAGLPVLVLNDRDLRDVADGLAVAAASLEDSAREIGQEHTNFEYLIGRAARFRRLRARTLRSAR